MFHTTIRNQAVEGDGGQGKTSWQRDQCGSGIWAFQALRVNIKVQLLSC